MSTIVVVKEALLDLKDRNGSSVYAINKWIEANKKGTVPKKHVMKAALAKGVSDGTLIQVKASYKLSPEAKKKAPKKKAKAAPKKKAAASKKKSAPKKKTAPKKKSAPKKKATATKKKSAPKKKATTTKKKKTTTKKTKK